MEENKMTEPNVSTTVLIRYNNFQFGKKYAAANKTSFSKFLNNCIDKEVERIKKKNEEKNDE